MPDESGRPQDASNKAEHTVRIVIRIAAPAKPTATLPCVWLVINTTMTNTFIQTVEADLTAAWGAIVGTVESDAAVLWGDSSHLRAVRIV